MSSPNKRSSTAATGSSGSVDFIFRTAMERQAGSKRQIRPKVVDDVLLGDDSDDSDFNVEEHDSVSGSDISKDSNDSDASGSDKKDERNYHNDSSDSDVPEAKSTLRQAMEKLSNDSPGFQPPGGGSKTKKKKKKPLKASKKKVSKANANKKAEKVQKPRESTKPAAKKNSYAGCVMDTVFKATCLIRDIRSDIDLTRKICSFCLGEKSDSTNEIVECDSCKITVHESCYGLSDSLSVSSDSSSTSATEPWFCDYCRNPNGCFRCALCPNSGGLLKATTEGQFVHLVCAQYTRGILSPLDNKAYLSRIPYSKWGNKPCALCANTNLRFAATGITVECDAGMCKQYVHISCAQKFGLLSDPFTSAGVIEDDQLYASCKLHGQKDLAKQRATIFKALLEQIRIKHETPISNVNSPTSKSSQNRIQEKLRKVRAKMAAKGITNSDGTSLVSTSVEGYKIPFRRSRLSGVEQKRKPRNLKSCALAVSQFLKKIENLGEDITTLELEEKNERIVANIKKRWNVPPSLTVEFTAYYFDREARIEGLSEQCEVLVTENDNLNDRQIALNTVLENEAVDHMEIIDDNLTMDKELKELRNTLKLFSPGNKSFNTSTILKGLPPTPRPKSPVRKLVSQRKQQKRPSSTGNNDLDLKKTLNRISLPPSGPGRLTLYVCFICKKSDQQHLITNCDNCKLNFHLGCLDPPLTRMPRRSKLVGMCSDCCEEKSEEEEVAVDTEAPRTLRGRTNLKRPEKFREIDDSDDEAPVKDKHVKKPKPAPKSPKANSVVPPVTSTKPVPDLLRLTSLPMGNGAVFWCPTNSPSVLSNYTDMNHKLAHPTPVGITQAPTFLPATGQLAKKQKVTETPVALKKANAKVEAKLSTSPHGKATLPNAKKVPKKLFKEKAVVDTVTNGTNPVLLAAMNGAAPHQVSKSSKLVLSPVNIESCKIGTDVTNHTITTPNSLRSGTVVNSGVGSVSKKGSARKMSPKPASVANNIKPPGQNLETKGNCNTAGSGGKCSVCLRAEDKKNLVMCDDCRLEFHFTCVPPFLPYNPKRRGYTWTCVQCGDDESDDEVTFIGVGQDIKS